jgi:hypothetical protein
MGLAPALPSLGAMPGKRQGLIYIKAGRRLPAYNEELGRGIEKWRKGLSTLQEAPHQQPAPTSCATSSAGSSAFVSAWSMGSRCRRRQWGTRGRAPRRKRPSGEGAPSTDAACPLPISRPCLRHVRRHRSRCRRDPCHLRAGRRTCQPPSRCAGAFPGIDDNAKARAHARTIAGWKPVERPITPVTRLCPGKGR